MIVPNRHSRRVVYTYLVFPMERLGTAVLFVYYGLLMIGAIPFGYAKARQFPDFPHRGWDYVFRKVNRMYLRALDLPIRVRGREQLPPQNIPIICAANHGSSLDAALFQAIIDRPGVAVTAPAGHFPWPFSFWLRKIGAIQVARSDAEQRRWPETFRGQAVVDEVVRRIKQGESVLIFPEGHLERSPHLSSFKTGAVRMALHSGAPLIPVSIRGDYRAWSASKFLLHPHSITLTFHDVPHQLPKSKEYVEDRSQVRLWTDQLEHRIAHGLDKEFENSIPKCDCRDTFRQPAPTKKKKSRPLRVDSRS